MIAYLEIYITELSKYFISVIMMLYVLVTAFALFREKEEGATFAITTLDVLMFAFHFTCFLSICFETGKIEYFVFYVFQQLLLLLMISLFRLLYPRGNKLLMSNMGMLLSVGFVMVTRLSYERALKQFFIVIVTAVIAMFVPLVVAKLELLKRFKWFYAILGIVALGCVLILGAVTNGSKLSYSLFGITFQPSEIVKIIFVFYLASALWKKHDLAAISVTAMIAGLQVMILVASKDLGNALIFFVVFVCLVYLASGKLRYFLAGIAGGSLAAVLAYRLFAHVRVRVLAYRDPFSVIDKEGYQITQSLFALSSGGYFGRGLFQGQPDTIPYVIEDFVFSALVQELGIIVGICVLLIALLCFVNMLKLSLQLKDRFYQLLVAGVGIVFLFQVFLTVGGGTKFIPMTGVTLPFISYGGSSILSSMILFYVAQGVFIAKHQEDMEYEKRREEYYRRKYEAKQRQARAAREGEEADY